MKNKILKISCFSAASVLFSCLAFSVSAQNELRSDNNPSQTYKPLYTLSGCLPSTAPAGYLWTSTTVDSSCYSVGGSNPPEREIFTSYFDKAIGASMRTCSAIRPSGWAQTAISNDYGFVCGHAGYGGPGEPIYPTIYTIQRVS